MHLSGCEVVPIARAKAALGPIPLMLVGGIRELGAMQDLVTRGVADFISLCRPLVRQPTLVRRFAEGRSEEAACTSCNRCYAAVCHDLPLRCYAKGLPKP